jgi:hypothetical protein
MCVNADDTYDDLERLEVRREESYTLTHMIYDSDLERVKVKRENFVC